MVKENHFQKMKIQNSFIMLALVSLLLAGLAPTIGFAADDTSSHENGEVTIHFFEQRGCPDCARAKEFLDDYIREEYPDVNIVSYSIMESENQKTFHEMMEERDVDDYRTQVPVIFIGDNYFQLFYEADKELLRRAIEGEDVQSHIYRVRGEHLVNLPVLGEVNVGEWSIPLLALVIGFIDGLNVCSIGALILILTIVLGAFKSRWKILAYGGLFILTTATVYGVLVFAWTALARVIESYFGILNILIGLAALIGGIVFFKKFIDFYRYGPACEFTDNRFIMNATNKVKKAFSDSASGPLILITSVIIFAAIVTIIELPCSIALPMVYGGVVADQGFTGLVYFLYIVLYLLFYMSVQLVIFLGAVITKDLWFAESKFITWVYLFGALVLFALAGYYLITYLTCCML